MNVSSDRRTALISVVVSTVIAGMFGLMTKLVPEGYIRYLVPHEGGTITASAPGQVCQIVRFWVPSQLPATPPGGRQLALMVDDLNKAVTNSYGGWTRWPVNGQWKDPDTQSVSTEDGYLYEVGITSCADAETKKLYAIVDRFVRIQMNQSALYFSATRFDKPN